MFKASPFKLRMYETCPQQYKFSYIDHLDKEYKKPKPYLTMGAHVHNALKDFYEQLEPEDRTYERLEKMLRKRWLENRKGFATREDEAKWGVKALNMLRLFVHRMDMQVTPVMLEDYYDIEVDPTLKILGRIDRADQLEDGTLHVIDYKTGKYTPDDVSNLQLILYALIVSANQKRPVTKASYLFLPTWEWHSVDISQEEAEAAVDLVKEQVEQIRQEKEFTPTPNTYCKSCDYLPICPARAQVEVMIEAGEL
ncbi:MAG: PD-(D/E)XK nuclease family protein [Candidatus Kerfeldbacteria bacterium]|nr:PD-(D/E)XK nuclease family protein [Candidatus Kerfeldbacteria bacterium]